MWVSKYSVNKSQFHLKIITTYLSHFQYIMRVFWKNYFKTLTQLTFVLKAEKSLSRGLKSLFWLTGPANGFTEPIYVELRVMAWFKL